MIIQSDSHHGVNVRRNVFAALMFVAAYFMTITVNAQTSAVSAPPDVIQLNASGPAIVTGTVVSADENFVVIETLGREMKVDLDDVDLKDEADHLFTRGMEVTVQGEMAGDDFGTPLMTAKSITATTPR